MAKEYLAKYRSRATDSVIIFYKKNGFIHKAISFDGDIFTDDRIVSSVPSIIKGYEEIGLQDD